MHYFRLSVFLYPWHSLISEANPILQSQLQRKYHINYFVCVSLNTYDIRQFKVLLYDSNLYLMSCINVLYDELFLMK